MNFNRVACLALLACGLAAGRANAQSNEFRGLWIDAWGTGFLNASEVTQLVADARANNFNALVVQMRRRGDSFYNNLAPGNDPKTTAVAAGFDALQDVVTKAHDTSGGKQRLEVHCWVATYKIWSSAATPPSQSGHVFNLHPEYLTQDFSGDPFTSEAYCLDPGHPDVSLWNYIMATNVVRRYDVDGFHWDYIRYPEPDSGYNPTAIARYNAEFGLTGQPASTSTQFSDWRRRQVTDFLRWCNADLLFWKSNLVVSCAVFGSRSDAYNARFQDWAAWNSEGIIDICMPMGYTSDNAGIFVPRVDDAFTHQGVRRVYNGQGAYLNAVTNSVWQLDYIRNKPLLGSMLYSYRTPNSGTPDIAGSLAYIKTNHQPTWVNVPTIPWKATPTKGILRGTVTRSDNGAAIYNATVKIFTSPNRTQKSEPHGKFAFFETTPGTYQVTATGTGLGTVTNNFTLAAGGNITVNLVVPVTDNSPPVISNMVVSAVTDTSAVVSWATDENANSAVDYGTNVSYVSLASNATQTVSHTMTLTNLAPNTLHHFRVRSRNAAALESASGDFTFTTNPSGVVDDVIVESRLANGNLTANPPYSDSGFSDSTLKSSATPLTGSSTQGARYAVSGTPTFTVTPPLAVAGGSYDVFLTQGSASSISDDIIVAVSQSGGTGLPTTTTIFQEAGGNSWELLGRLKLNAGVTVPTITFTYSGGTLAVGSRMYSDAIKFVYVPPPPPPVITNQPTGKSVNQGANAMFTVAVTGATPLSYQWRFEGTNLAGATLSSYTRSNCQPNHEGDYSVVVTNVAGAATSVDAFLVVNIPPYIGVQPQGQTVWRGQDVGFSVIAGGTEPFHYQWRFKGTNLAGATESDYTRATAQTNHAGNYSVVVTNVAGSVTSSPALLAVNLPPPPQFQSITVLPDNRAELMLLGVTNLAFAIEASSNLAGWSELMTGVLTNVPAQLTDDSASNATRRFYRARQ